MTKEPRNSNDQVEGPIDGGPAPVSYFGLHISFVIRASSFAIFGGGPRRLDPPCQALGVCVLLIAGLLTAGCGTQTQKFLEPREIGDKVTDADLETFLQVVNDLPDKKLPEMPVLFKKPPLGTSSGPFR